MHQLSLTTTAVSLTSPHKLNGIGDTLSLVRRRANLEEDKGFVKMSVSLSRVARKQMRSEPSASISQTK